MQKKIESDDHLIEIIKSALELREWKETLMKNLNDTVVQLIKELDDVKQNYLDVRHENEQLKKDLEIVKSNYSTGDNYLLTYDTVVGPIIHIN